MIHTVRMPRVGWSVRCTAQRTYGRGPCRAWAIRGGYVCKVHGGSIRKVREKAAQRLEAHRQHVNWLRSVAKRLAQPPPRPDMAEVLRIGRQQLDEQAQRQAELREARLARRRERRKQMVNPPRAADGFARWKQAQEQQARERAGGIEAQV
jgi:hypothetical protein